MMVPTLRKSKPRVEPPHETVNMFSVARTKPISDSELTLNKRWAEYLSRVSQSLTVWSSELESTTSVPGVLNKDMTESLWPRRMCFTTDIFSDTDGKRRQACGYMTLCCHFISIFRLIRTLIADRTTQMTVNCSQSFCLELLRTICRPISSQVQLSLSSTIR